MQGWRRYVLVLLATIGAGFVCARALPFLTSPRGAAGPTILQSETPILAIVAVGLTTAITTLLAGGVARLVNTAVGLFVLGCGLGVVAVRSATMAEVAFSEGSLLLAGIEAILWAGLVLVATSAVWAIGGPLSDIEPAEEGEETSGRWLAASYLSCLLVIPAVWLITQTIAAEQTLMAVVIGAVLAGLGARLCAPDLQPRLIFALTCAAGGLACIVASFFVVRPLADALVKGTIPPWCLVRPIDLAAGSLIGVSMGIGWARSFLHRDEQDEPAETSTAPAAAESR